jgi:hypothetical protein
MTERHRRSDGIVGIKVRLARNIDREKPCHDSIAVIHPGKAQHAGEFRCAACGAHRGWCSHATRNLILETLGRSAEPSEPIIVCQPQEKSVMSYEQKDDTASIWVNDRKREGEAGKNDPDSTGSAKIGGVEYYVSAWRRVSKSNKPYLSLSFKPKNADAARDQSKSHAEDLNDAIPF